MKQWSKIYCLVVLFSMAFASCSTPTSSEKQNKTAAQILGNPNCLAISYGGYREVSRDSQPSIAHLKEDMRILSAMGIKILRTYNVQLPQAENILKAITELQAEDPEFEMYVMLGAWIDCQNAWQSTPANHDIESEANAAEIQRAVDLANTYPEIVKILAVGNEAMVKWAASYFVQPNVILKWVNHLQDLKKEGKLDKNLWITSSDDYASWGGGDTIYHCTDLENLIKAVDYVSLHTYPMHNTHYNPEFWGTDSSETRLSKKEIIQIAMVRAVDFAKKQYTNTAQYIHNIDSTKIIHIGETGWASSSAGFYGVNGSKACDEYKQGLYYKKMREWTSQEGISCFFFEAFNEQWKNAQNPANSENHFGLFKIDGQAKYAVWNLVDQNAFDGLTRDENTITKTYQGNLDSLLNEVELPPLNDLLP